ncbi:DUF4760 domain-containing protein [Actinophytocola xanthii]|uniref:Uncharacterized protein n=1 Tax=Actinophytocola xanthii TaxID=1912961 RepID=A0A1Q8CS26_9PSEU|nr:hypothetical protein [Actinophytocola xanthii]OLF17171.1 hypothetical protein BU204_13030 [Actinophytocola xanthii]
MRRGDRVRRIRFRWSLAHPLVRLLVQATVAAAIAISVFAFLSIGDVINETAASVLVAVVFGAASVLQLRQAQRRQYTVGLLTNFQSSESLKTADMWMAARIGSRQELAANPPSDELVHVIAMLDYYEFLATLALRGFIDTPLVRTLRGGTMARCFTICRTYIMTCRSEIGSELYCNFELFVEEHNRTAKSG